MTSKPKTTTTLGVMVQRTKLMGTEYVAVRTMLREGDAEHPINCCWDRWSDSDPAIKAKTNAAADLKLQGFVSDTDGQFIALEPAYYDLYGVRTDRATVILKTLKRVDAILQHDEAREHGDVFTAFCKAIGAEWTVIQMDGGGNTRYADCRWRFLTIPEGRNHLRRVIEQAKAEFAAAHPDKVRAA